MPRRTPKTQVSKKKSSKKVQTTTSVDTGQKPDDSKVVEKRSLKTVKRDLTYPEIDVMICEGKEAMDVVQAKKILGWQEESENIEFGTKFLCKDVRGRKVRCNNNVSNRPLNHGVLQTLKQEHLRKRWRFNGEPIIVGRTGLLLNGQHSLISFVLAHQELEDHLGKWHDYWQSSDELRLEKLVVAGVEEDDHIVNTIDTARPRSLSDVIARSHYFEEQPPMIRKQLARITDHAIRLLWYRTGARINAFAPIRTHAESTDFLERHLRLLECVNHIHEENADKAFSKMISAGYASAMMYLMATSSTDPKEYLSVADPTEDLLEFSNWDKAADYWSVLGAKGDELNQVRIAMVKLSVDGRPTAKEQCALIAKSWPLFLEGMNLTPKRLELQYQVDENEVRQLIECPVVGGIDVGEPEAREDVSSISQEEPAAKPKKTKRKKVVDKQPEEQPPKKKTPTKKKTRSKMKTASRKGDDWTKGDRAWVQESPSDEPYIGRLIDSPFETDGAGVRVVVRDNDGSEWEVPVAALSLEPTAVSV